MMKYYPHTCESANPIWRARGLIRILMDVSFLIGLKVLVKGNGTAQIKTHMCSVDRYLFIGLYR